MSTNEIFLIAMAVILAVPYAVWRLGRTDYVAPLVVVQIVTGIVLGPGILGAVFPEAYRFVFNPQVVQSLGAAAAVVLVGVALSVFQQFVAIRWVDHHGRRPLMITGACAMGVGMIVLGTTLYLQTTGVLARAAMLLFVASFSFS